MKKYVLFFAIMCPIFSLKATQHFQNNDILQPEKKPPIKMDENIIIEEIFEDPESGDTTISDEEDKNISEIIDIRIEEFPTDYMKTVRNAHGTINTIYWEGQKENLHLMINTLKNRGKIRVNNEKEYFVQKSSAKGKVYQKIADIYNWKIKKLYATLDKLDIRKRKKWTNWKDKNNVKKLKNNVKSGTTIRQLETKFRCDFRTIKKVCEKNRIDANVIKENQNPPRNIKKWTSEEISEIQTAREKGETYHKIALKYGVCRTVIKKIVAGKTNLNQNAWTEEEEKDLLEKVELHGKNWEKIGGLMGRSKNAVKTKYGRIIRKNNKEEKMIESKVIESKKRKNNSSKHLLNTPKRVKN